MDMEVITSKDVRDIATYRSGHKKRESWLRTAELAMRISPRKAERATTYPRPWIKSSRQGGPTGVWTQAPFLVFGVLFLKNRQPWPKKIGSSHR